MIVAEGQAIYAEAYAQIVSLEQIYEIILCTYSSA